MTTLKFTVAANALGLAHSNRAPRLRGGYAHATRRANNAPCRALDAHVRVRYLM